MRAAAVVLALLACGPAARAQTAASTGVVILDGRAFPDLAPLPPMPYPADNPPDAKKEALGRDLFLDPLLSGDRKLSCAACHMPDKNFRDGRARARARAELELPRKAPSLKNVGYNKTFFWDGRAPSLERQFFDVLTSHDEMRMRPDELVKRLRAEPRYAARFEDVFGVEGVSTRTISYAVAAYERSLRVGDTMFDRFLRGEVDLYPGQREALALFKGKARCIVCHNGPTMSDGKFHNTGLRRVRGEKDRGREGVDGQAASFRQFRTPMLRNASHSTPYMHNGSLQRVEDMLEFYNRGGDEKKNLDPDMKPLGLTHEEILKLKTLFYVMGEIAQEPALYDHPTPKEEEAVMRRPGGPADAAPGVGY